MSENRIPPTPEQRRLVNIGMFIQFHLAAVGHLAVWLMAYYDLQRYNGGSGELFVYQGIPTSFAVLIGFYIIFRLRLAYSSFGSALVFMIVLNVTHALFMWYMGMSLTPLFFITPLRLAIPIVLYSIALYHYNRHVVASRDETTNQIQQEAANAT